jgi:A/G-specific adenine glycosylase
MPPNAARTRAFQRALLAWYDATGRDLPWRRTRDPYAILVSELMLQQTQVARVEEAWVAFLGRFPTVGSLADAPVADVVAAWRGLGYNRRAINLRRAATAIVSDHGGRVPADVAVLETLPGIGPYTARAVATFAFGAEAAPVDVNVARVLARAVAGKPLGRAEAQALADALVADVPGGDFASWSHALMDLGARRCTARNPGCGTCPVRERCAWRSGVGDGDDPAASGAVRARRQGRFEGSDRYHRGRVVDALRDGSLAAEQLPTAAGLAADPPRLDRIVAGLVADGLAEWRRGRLALPGSRM